MHMPPSGPRNKRVIKGADRNPLKAYGTDGAREGVEASVAASDSYGPSDA